MFGDISDLVYPKVPRLESYSRKLEATQNSHVVSAMYCVKHFKMCPTAKAPVFDVSGLPCPDMSTAGKRLRRAGATSEVYIAHGKYVTQNATPLLLVECTKESWLHEDEVACIAHQGSYQLLCHCWLDFCPTPACGVKLEQCPGVLNELVCSVALPAASITD